MLFGGDRLLRGGFGDICAGIGNGRRRAGGHGTLSSRLSRIERIDDRGGHIARRVLGCCIGLGALAAGDAVGIAVEQAVHGVLQSNGCGVARVDDPALKGDGMALACRREVVWLPS